MTGDLFGVEPVPACPPVPGLACFDGWMEGAAAVALLGRVDDGNWSHDLKRRVRHFGYRYDYRARSVSVSDHLGPLPDWLADLGRRLFREGVFDQPPDQVIINEYLPGQGIAPHVDCIPCFGPSIAIISLGGGVAMSFRHTVTDECHEMILRPGSLLSLSGQARYEWTHGIPARKSDVVSGVRVPRSRRVSLTFRTVISSGAPRG
jgi:alkylated DNA repair dioxygenase AlkB